MRPFTSTPSNVYFHGGVKVQLPKETKEIFVEMVSPEAAPAPVVEVVEVAAPIVEAEPVVEAAVDPAAAEPAVEEPATEEELVWSSAMTKSELLAVALKMGLPVTSANTKSEILAALDATKQ